MKNSLRDRLKSLGVQEGIKKSSEFQLGRRYPIEKSISGEYLQNSFGEVFIHSDEFPTDYQHGNTSLSTPVGITTLARWAKTIDLELLNSRDLVFLDTETTGLSGGTGTFVFLVGIGFQTVEGFTVKQFFLRDPAEESAFLISLEEAISGFKGLVTFNGKSFDVPILKTRYILNGFQSPFIDKNHIDLLPLARRLWKYRLANRNLGILETEILNLERSSEEIPGWMIPEMYIDYCRSGDSRPLKGVFYHNAMDIVSLAGLLMKISHLVDPGKQDDVVEGVDIMAVGKLYESLGNDKEAGSFYEVAIQRQMEDDHHILAKKTYASLSKRKRKWDLAIPIWKELAASGQWDACVELAKYFEHSLDAYDEARCFAELGRKIVEKIEMPKVKRDQLGLDFDRRISRLSAKIEKNADK